MYKTNYSVARVVTYTKQSIGKAERHNERKNANYSNMNVDLEQTKNNVYYKTCNITYNERLKELDNLIQHIYEDNVFGKISDEMFSNFSTNYTNEQKDLKEKIEILNKSISATEQKEIAITSFVDKVKKYQQIDIYYSGVGIISVSANEYNMILKKNFKIC